ncbi:MAG: sugar ABC transporter permease [Anaerolineae bacterium]|nr:sugar ABC transporter permease [Anaerolineae bacterium]
MHAIRRQSGFFARIFPFLLLAPALIFIFFVQLYPGLYTFYLSTRDTEGAVSKYIGFKNYDLVFNSAIFKESVVHTLIFLVGYVSLTLIAGLLVALVLNRKLRWSGLYITLIFIPWVLSDVIVGYIWKLYADPGSGLLSPFFALPILGLNGDPLLIASPPESYFEGIPFPPAPAMYYVIFAAAWKALPFTTLLLLAALQTVPKEVTESARIDGANHRQLFFNITLPLILPTLLVTLFNLTLGGMNGVGMIFSLTGGGPGSATEVLSYLLYSIGFGQLNFGRAAALSVVIFAVNLTLIILSLRISRSRAELI